MRPVHQKPAIRCPTLSPTPGPVPVPTLASASINLSNNDLFQEFIQTYKEKTRALMALAALVAEA